MFLANFENGRVNCSQPSPYTTNSCFFFSQECRDERRLHVTTRPSFHHDHARATLFRDCSLKMLRSCAFEDLYSIL